MIYYHYNLNLWNMIMHDLEWLLCYGEMMMNQKILEYHFIYSVDSREHHGRKPGFFTMETWAMKEIFPYSHPILGFIL